MEKKSVLINITTSVILQIVTIISGFILPKIILIYFGSSINGLVSSINQCLNYIYILEGGISAVIMSSLYKPLMEKDNKKISGIVNAADSFFKKIGISYIVYMICVAVIYPIYIKTTLSPGYVSALVIVLGMNLFIQYFFSLTFKVLLNADRKVYFVAITQIVIIVINTVLVVISAVLFKDILIIKIVSAVVFLIQPIFYRSYVKKHYTIDKSVPKDNGALKQRWDGFGQNLAYFIHNNTDIVVITIFATLADVSVYSIYLLVINALKNLVISISSAIVPSMGNILVRSDKEKINDAFDLYEFGIYYISSLLFTCGIILIVPFVCLYTKGINDANYIQPVFATILGLAEMVYCIRDPYISVSYSSGHFKQTAKYAYIEAIANIVISIILINKFGIVGVAIGTLVSMTIRTVFSVLYLKNNILMRPFNKFLKKVFVFGFGILLTTTISALFLNYKINGYLQWVGMGCIVFILTGTILSVLSSIFFKKEFKLIFNMRLRRER